MSQPIRIALLGIYHESNTFLEQPTTLEDFKNGHWLTGEDIRKEYQHAFHEIGGMLEVLDQEGIEVVPVMYAEATPGGTISSDAYRTLLEKMTVDLSKVLPLDGCLVVPHGAAVCEDFPDMDGHWLSQIRNVLGKEIPMIGTIDPHANVSPLMIQSTDALVAYKTNPHIDQREVGKEAAKIMLSTLSKRIKPLQLLVELPLAISIEQQYTNNDPCKSLYAFADRLNNKIGMVSISVVLGFPYADVKEMGTSFIVITDNNKSLAVATGKELERYIHIKKDRFVGKKEDISLILPLLKDAEKPVLLLDMGDNVGGGGPGNSTFLLEALERLEDCRSFICLYDPQVVIRSKKYRKGETFTIRMTTGRATGGELNLKVTLIEQSPGVFEEPAPRHGGQVHFDMGDIAIVSTQQGNVIMFTSLRVFPCSLRQLTSFNLLPSDFDVIVAKGVNAPIAAYGPVCPTIYQVNTPGITQADMTLFHYKNRKKPLFPFEN